MPRTAAEIFIRPVKKAEIGKDKGRFIRALPEKAGYRRVYKPYGSKGAGFYYARKA